VPTKTCKNCGSEIDERASICATCGENPDKTVSGQGGNSNVNEEKSISPSELEHSNNDNNNDGYNGFFIGAIIKLTGHLLATSIIWQILRYGIDLVIFWRSFQIQTAAGENTTFGTATLIAAFLIWIGIFIKWKMAWEPDPESQQ
jgi:hypothetical protein